MRKREVHAGRVGDCAVRLNVVDVVRRAQGHGCIDLGRHAERDLGIAIELLGPASVAPPVVEPHRRHEWRARVPVHFPPRGQVGIGPHGRPPSRAVSIAERCAELARRDAPHDPPPVVQLDVPVGVRRTLDGRAGRRPVLPPVEVPPCLLVHRCRVQRLHAEPGIPALLVRLQQEAQVVYFEAGRAPLVAGLEPRHAPPDFAEQQLFRVARERRPCRVVGCAGAGPLVVVDRVPLRERDRRRGAGEAAQVEGSGDLVVAPQEPVPEVQGAHVGASAQQAIGPPVEAAIHRGEHEPDAAFTVPEILLRSHHRVVGGRLHSPVERACGALGDRVEDADGLAAPEAAGQLRCAVDGRRSGRFWVAVAELRRAADAPRVEQAFAVTVHLVAIDVEPKDPRALDEERPPFLEERLEDGEVEHRRIRFHLPEVGVHRAIERQVRRETVLQVRARSEFL